MNRGVTLIETMIVASLFLILTGFLFAGWIQSAKAWETASQRGEIVSQAQELFRRLDRSLESSRMTSVEIQDSPSILSFAATKGLNGSPEADSVKLASSGSVAFQRYIVCYWSQSSKLLSLREQAIPNNSTESIHPTPLSTVDFGGGARPLSFYAQTGRIVAEGVSRFTPEIDGHILSIECDLETAKGKIGQYRVAILLRN